MHDLIELLEQHNIPYKRHGEHHHVTRNWINTDCPFCSPGSKHYRLGFNVRFGYANCWTCGSVSAQIAVSRLTKISENEAKKVLKNFKRDKFVVAQANAIYESPPLTSLGTRSQVYLRDRGFNLTTLARIWNVRYESLLGIYIPILLSNTVVSHTIRSVVENNARYINAAADREAFPAKELLYGEDLCQGVCVVVEGCTDAWRLGPGAVAVMGATFTRAQVVRISKYPVRVVCFDADETGRRKGRELANQLECFPGETHLVTLQTGKDPADCDPQEIAEIRRRFLDGC